MRSGLAAGVLSTVLAVLSCETAVAQSRDSLPEARRLEVRALLEARDFAGLDRRFNELQRRYEAGGLDDWSLVLEYQPFYETTPKMEALTTEWIARSPESYPALLARGIHYRKVGDQKRGGKWLSETPPENLEALWEHLDLSARDLVASLRLTRMPVVSYVHLMNVTKHRERGKVNRIWLDASVAVDRVSYGARRRFMYTLTPRWGGSYKEMWSFLKECEAAAVPAEHLRIYEALIHLDQASMLEKDRPREALPLYRESLALLEGIDNLERRNALERVVQIQRSENRLQDAAKEVDELLALYPKSGRLTGYRAWIKEKNQKLDDAWRDYLLAAEFGDAWSQYKVGRALYFGSPPIVARDQRQGIQWLERSAAGGYQEAKKFLGTLPK